MSDSQNLQNQQNQFNMGEAALEKISQGDTFFRMMGEFTQVVGKMPDRNIDTIKNRLIATSKRAGGLFVYSWIQGGKVLKGLSYSAAMEAFNEFGRMALYNGEMKPLKGGGVMINPIIIDLVTFASYSRPYALYFSTDGDNKTKSVQFLTAISKAHRNLILSRIPADIRIDMLDAAMGPVRNKVMDLIQKKDATNVTVFENMVNELKTFGQTDQTIQQKYNIRWPLNQAKMHGKDKEGGIDIELLVSMEIDLEHFRTNDETFDFNSSEKVEVHTEASDEPEKWLSYLKRVFPEIQDPNKFWNWYSTTYQIDGTEAEMKKHLANNGDFETIKQYIADEWAIY